MSISIIPLLILAIVLLSVLWAVGDARERGKSGFLVGLLVLLLQPWPLGLVLWLVFRPSSARLS